MQATNVNDHCKQSVQATIATHKKESPVPSHIRARAQTIVRRRTHRHRSALILASAVLFAAPLAALAAAPGVSRDAEAQALELRDGALAGSRAYEWVERLTTEVGPRLAGSDAEARARDWAVALLKDLGFANVRVEPFTIDGWARGEETAAILAPFPQPLSVTALGGSVATEAAGLEGELVLFPTLGALEAAPPGSLAGKIAYVGHRMQQTQDGSSYGYFGKLRRVGASVAASKGATGLLIRSIGTDSHRMPHTGAMRYDPEQPRIPAGAVSNPDADQIERIAARGEPIRVRMALSPTFTGEVPSGNVIAEIPGRERPDEYVVIGGHLDSWDLGTGAVDDGAGVAISLEAARMILESGWQPRRSIRLILWGAEEVGLLGGYAYRDRYASSLRQNVIGTESDFGAGQIWKMTYRVNDDARPVVDLIGQLIEPLGVAPGGADVDGSGPDLTPMVQAGMPSFRLVQDGRDYFDLHHTPDDTLDKIDPADLDQNVAAFVVFTLIAAETTVSDWGWREPSGE